MKKVLVVLFACFATQLSAQRYLTKAGSVDFLSKAPLETIEGKNKSTAALLDSKTGSLDVIVMVKSFVFEKQLMQEHFNENYMESDKFPKASYKGVIDNPAAVNFAKDGEYQVSTTGKLSIHGVSKDVKQTGKLIVKGGKVILSSNFSVALADYGISIPGAVKDKVAKDVKIVVNCILDPK